MMRNRVSVVIVVVVALFLVAILAVVLARSRGAYARQACLNNLRELSLFAAESSQWRQAHPGNTDIPGSVPAGTIVNADLPFERRLSWLADIPAQSRKAIDGTDPWSKVDRTAAWDADTNRTAANKTIGHFLCPANPNIVPANHPGTTQYVGMAGVGRDAATMGLGPPVPAASGCFRYDSPTPLRLIAEHDGTSQSVLFIEVSKNLGSWLRGGPGTVRAYDPESTSPHLGKQGQFGGNHDGVATLGFADGSGRVFTDSIDVRVFRSLLTIAGAEKEPLPGGE